MTAERISRKILRAGSVLGLLITMIFPLFSSAAMAEGEEVVYISYLPVTLKSFKSGPGNLQGVVVDALEAQPINGATVCILPDQCYVTDEDGAYFFENIPYGAKIVEASHIDYLSSTLEIYVGPAATVTLDFALSPLLFDDEYRIIVTWGEEPQDLDAQLWLPYLDYPLLYFEQRGNCDEHPYACLGPDVTGGEGPETITIAQLGGDGNYVYGVLNVNFGNEGVPEIIESSAEVQVYSVAGLIEEFTIPEEGIGDLWYVFDLNPTTREIVPVNCITFDPGSSDRPACGEELNPERVRIIK